VLLAVIERYRSGLGQVVDAAMIDGVSYLGTSLFKGVNAGSLKHGLEDVGGNAFNQGAHWYSTYECADGKHVAVCSLEPKFYAAFLRGLGLDGATLPRQMDRSSWPSMKQRVGKIFAARTRDEWTTVFEGVDACVTPVLDVKEAQLFRHSVLRGGFPASPAGYEGCEPAPAPRLSRTPGHHPRLTPSPGQHTNEVLTDFGFSLAEVSALHANSSVSANFGLQESDRRRIRNFE